MIKVLFIQHGLGYGGATKSLLLMQKALANEFKLYTISQKVSRKTREIIDEFKKYSEFHEMAFPSIYSYSAATIKDADFNKALRFFPQQIIDFINTNNIDIVHVNSSLFSHLLKSIKDHTKAKIVVHLREMIPNDVTSINKFIISNHIEYADKIIAISNNEVKFYPRLDKVLVIPNSHEFEKTDSLLSTEPSENTITVGMCSNFVEYKGHLDFLEMIRIVNEKLCNQEVRFVLIGYPKSTIKEHIKRLIKPGFKQKFDNTVKRNRITNLKIIDFTFNIYEEVSKWDIYVRPDYTGHPWGRDVIEAMGLKKPIIATGDSQFLIENEVTGYLVPPFSPKRLAEKVEELIRNPIKRKRMGEFGYKKIKSLCDFYENGMIIKKLYNEVALKNSI